jgi:outer membrane protein OmpA-like peptidoglycan-associated protein
MAATLVSDLSNLFQNQALSQAASELGESEGSVMRGFQTASAAIVGGLAGKAGQPGFLKQAFDLIAGPLNDSSILSNIRGLFSRSTSGSSDGLGGKFLSMLFGGEQGSVADKVGQASGLKPSSASALMGFAAPMVLGLLGKRVKEGHLDMSSFSRLVQQEGSGASSMLPAGLGSLLGAPVASATAAATNIVSPPVQATSSRRWLWPLLALLAAIGLVWFLNRERAGEQVRNVATNVSNFFKISLPNGLELNIPRGGLEARLVEFVKSPLPVNDTTWFDFDRLTFDTNSAILSAQSQEQLANIAAILKAYPSVQIKIGGYTDNIGDYAANMQLSQQRADSVQQQLVGMGIAAERIQAEGYGPQHPIADNSTEAGRARNRRIALRVTQK